MSGLREITDGLLFPEGPVAMPDGSVVLVEIGRRCLTRVRPDGRKEIVATPGGGPNGIAIGPDGKAYVCNNGGFEFVTTEHGTRPVREGWDYSGGRIERIDLATGAVEVLYRGTHEVQLRGPNDIVFDAHGGFYFTDLGKLRHREMDRGAVFYGKADGSLLARGGVPDGDAERHRPVARRQDALRRRDRGGAALGLSDPRARRARQAALAEPAWRPHAGGLARRPLPALRFARGRGQRQHLRRDPGARRHHRGGAGRQLGRARPDAGYRTPPTSASAARTFAPPTSRSRARAGWWRSTGPARACRSNT